ncbi:MAG: Hpt domain-containing protein [Planctomycetaceae bacterium]
MDPSAWVNVAEILERCLGNRALAARIVGRFQASVVESAEAIQRLALSADLSGVAKAAHRLRGEAANVSCEPIRAEAELVEELARKRLHDGVMLTTDQLVRLAREFPSAADLIPESDLP